MANVLSQESITASLLAFWDAQFGGGVTTVYPGMKVNTSNLAEWVEVWVDSWSRRPQRVGGVPLVDVTVSVHCFVRAGADAGRIHELTDQVRATFAQQAVELHDYTLSGRPLLGCIRLKEPETRNLSRQAAGALQTVLHHTAVVIRGVAQTATTSA